MRIGTVLNADGNMSLDDIVGSARQIESAGLDHIWMANIFSWDAIATLGHIGRETERIGLGTAVTPTYPRHPTAIAQQAMTAYAASNGRFHLGIGLSHKVVIEDMLGFSYDKPARHMREYLNVLMPLVRGEEVNFDGEHYNVHGLKIDIPAKDMPVLIAALGPAMLKVAGELCDGTITWMVGANTIRDHIVPGMGRDDAQVVCGVPIVMTTNVDEARRKIDEQLVIYGQLPSYRAMLDREGAAGPGDIAIVGDENALRGELRRYEEAGVTDFNAAIMPIEDGAYGRTLEFLSSLK